MSSCQNSEVEDKIENQFRLQNYEDNNIKIIMNKKIEMEAKS